MELTKNEVLIYSNEFRDLRLPKLTEVELKAYLAILFNLQGQGSNEIRLYNDDLFLDRNENWEYRTKIMDNVRKKFVSFVVRKITETPTHIIDETTLFFKKIIIHYQKENPDDGHDTSKLFNCIDVQINEEFVPLINNLKKHFTKVEMGEILNLSGWRSIILYLSLKTFKITGEYVISLDDFRAKFEVPKSYKMCDIDKDILAPMIKELSKPRNLFDQVRIPFENLKVEKIKERGRGRGGVVVKLKFTFKPQGVIEAKIHKIKESSANPKSSKPESEIVVWFRAWCEYYNANADKYYTSSLEPFKSLGAFRFDGFASLDENNIKNGLLNTSAGLNLRDKIDDSYYKAFNFSTIEKFKIFWDSLTETTPPPQTRTKNKDEMQRKLAETLAGKRIKN